VLAREGYHIKDIDITRGHRWIKYMILEEGEEENVDENAFGYLDASNVRIYLQ